MMSLPLQSDILTKRGAAHAMDGAPTTRPLGLPPTLTPIVARHRADGQTRATRKGDSQRQGVLHPVVSRARVDNPKTDTNLPLLHETAWNSPPATVGGLYGTRRRNPAT